MTDGGLRHGDVVEVKSAGRVLSTARRRRAPWTPPLPCRSRMQYCGPAAPWWTSGGGQDLRHDPRHRQPAVCPTPCSSSSSDATARRHDGCQVECRPFWKECWFCAGSTTSPPVPIFETTRPPAALLQLTAATPRGPSALEGKNEVRLPAARAKNRPPRCLPAPQVLRSAAVPCEYQNGNVPAGRFLRVMTRAAVQRPMGKLGVCRGPSGGHAHGHEDDPGAHSRPAARERGAGEVEGGESPATLTRTGRNSRGSGSTARCCLLRGVFEVRRRRQPLRPTTGPAR